MMNHGKSNMNVFENSQSAHPHIYVVIATALGRTSLLLTRSLPSVYRQVGVNPHLVKVIVVDDNPIGVDNKSSLYGAISQGIEACRESMAMDDCYFQTVLLPNTRTKGHSGAGAWNTGIFHASTLSNPRDSFISILDDDDEFLPRYLSTCASCIRPRTIAVFARLRWVSKTRAGERVLSREDLTSEAFFIGNPGIQGSNTFISTQAFLELGGYDETFESATDRELMIRLMDYCHDKASIEVIPEVLVLHHDHEDRRVSADIESKHRALDLLYSKYKSRFSDKAFSESLRRAKRFFGYEHHEQ